MSTYTAQSREKGRAPVSITDRNDEWWKETLSFGVIFGLFVIYTTWRVFENGWFCYPWPGEVTYANVHHATYLSPFFSPYLPLVLTLNLPVLGAKMISPAIYILIFPLGFRMTCYYYRKAYYRAYFRDPAACAVAEPNPEARMKYTGERVFPFIVQNFHRFALYAAVVFVVILGWDAIKSFSFTDDAGGKHFGIGVGSIVLVINVLLIAGYTFGCHSWRHLVGGGVDCYSCSALSKTRHGLWLKVSYLNKRHAWYAMTSMIWVGLADLYINLVARGAFPDFHIIF